MWQQVYVCSHDTVKEKLTVWGNGVHVQDLTSEWFTRCDLVCKKMALDEANNSQGRKAADKDTDADRLVDWGDGGYAKFSPNGFIRVSDM